MPRIHHAIHVKAAPWLCFSLFMMAASFVRGDDLTGLPQDDPKDLSPSTAPAPTTQGQFVQMPTWSRNIIMPPLPYQLTPMGKKPVTAASTTPAQNPLAPPKDSTTAATANPSTDADKPKAPAPAETPAMITVSPFLQWIKANPQAAAAQAKQQAGAYQNPSAAGSGTPTGPTGNGEDPYWLPPLIDSAGPGAAAVGGSAAIYSTPQR